MSFSSQAAHKALACKAAAGSKWAPGTQGLWAEQGSKQLDREARHAGCCTTAEHGKPHTVLLVCLIPACWNSQPAPVTPLGQSPAAHPTEHEQLQKEAAGASPQGMENNNVPAASQLCCSWSQAEQGPTASCDQAGHIYLELHIPSARPTPGSGVCEPLTAHMPGQASSPKVSSEVCYLPASSPSSYLGEGESYTEDQDTLPEPGRGKL